MAGDGPGGPRRVRSATADAHPRRPPGWSAVIPPGDTVLSAPRRRGRLVRMSRPVPLVARLAVDLMRVASALCHHER
ncbi:putative leader peptide [Actinoalloteichus caeruleus]|uniref:putative leader peptide n=1 Tax=Actinoalloteichus cyanogriseus TaxID=2893586 RepID=UPI003BB92F0C